MREYITGHAIANQIRMKRSEYTAFLIVEGSNDKRVYRGVVDRESCSIEIAHGRENALVAIRILNSTGFGGVIAALDADFTRIAGAPVVEKNTFFTDLHDLECMILNSPAFDRVLEELGEEERVSAFAGGTPMVARHLAVNAMPLGCLRLISILDNLNLKFEGLTFSRFVNSKDLRIDTSEMIRQVMNNSQNHALDTAIVAERLSVEVGKGHDCWQISCGHDIVEILSISFRKTFSAKSGNEVTPENLERLLRLAYVPAYFRDTKLYRAIVLWENDNPGARIFDRSHGETPS